MIKLVNMLVQGGDYMREEFVEQRRGSRAELAREFPGLVRCAAGVPTDPERSEYDGIVELYFEGMATLKAVFDPGVGQRMNADMMAFTDMERGPTLYVGETVHLGRS